MAVNSSVQFVVKTSKYCNLRCHYCYEFSHLGDKSRAGLADIRRFFSNVNASIGELEIEDVSFFWHGGEPFLIPLEYYVEAAGFQHEIFGDKIDVYNIPQTNLTVLTDRHVSFLKDGGFFTHLGISFDVWGDQRVDTKGQVRTKTILRNLRTLIENDIPFGAIAVLERNTLQHVRKIYNFYDELKISHRILPYYMSAGSSQAQDHGITYDELVTSFKAVFHEWLASQHATPVDPIMDYIYFAIFYMKRSEYFRFDRSNDERVFIVDVNGDVYGLPEAYDPNFRYGNIFQTPLAAVIDSEPRRRSNALSAERMDRFCKRCPYFGPCSGAFVADATYEQRKLLDTSGCPVRALVEHIVDTFENSDLKELILSDATSADLHKRRPDINFSGI